jgi:MoaA/NifB/PqqE/SkfB family radical SAM enzyme
MECLHIPEIPYGEFSQRVHLKGERERLPLMVSIDFTERCNLGCAHCYINLPAGDREAQNRELTFAQWARILDEAAEKGCLWLLLTGGEPLLRPDFKDLYRHAKKLGMIVSLFTNGTLISPELADLLGDLTPFSVEITVYGRTRATYEAVTGVPGSYEKCLRGIDLLLARQVPLELKTMVMTLNAHEILDLKAWAEGLGVGFRFDPLLNARLDGGKKPLLLRLSPDEVLELDIGDEVRLRSWQEFLEKFGKSQNSDHLFKCGAGIDSFHLDAYGGMQICMMSRDNTYDLLRGSLDEGWLEFIPRLRRQKIIGDYPCSRCALFVVCDQCPGWSQLECGNPETPVAYLCQVAHRRAAALGLPVTNGRLVEKASGSAGQGQTAEGSRLA